MHLLPAPSFLAFLCMLLKSCSSGSFCYALLPLLAPLRLFFFSPLRLSYVSLMISQLIYTFLHFNMHAYSLLIPHGTLRSFYRVSEWWVFKFPFTCDGTSKLVVKQESRVAWYSNLILLETP